MKQLLLALLLVMLADYTAWAQLVVHVTDATFLGPIEGATVDVYCSGELRASGETDENGLTEFPLTVNVVDETPQSLGVTATSYPNPFEVVTHLDINTGLGGELGVYVYDLLGRLVVNHSRPVQPGAYTIRLDLSGLPPGSYFVSIRVPAARLSSATLIKAGSGSGLPKIEIEASENSHLGSWAGDRTGNVAKAAVSCEIQVSATGYVANSQDVDFSASGTVGVALERDPMINAIGMSFARIPAGTFQMGSTHGFSDELPVHEVTITRDFYIGTYEVTQGQWQAVMDANPSWFGSCGADCPVESVTWYNVIVFANALSVAEGLPPCYDSSGNVKGGEGGDVYRCEGYRLPTEAEREYVARAGTTTEYSFGDDVGQLDAYAWYSANSTSKTHPVGQKQPNPWGLYDVSGNVWEWAHDWYSESYNGLDTTDPQGPATGTFRMSRGGAWIDSGYPGDQRSSFRYGLYPDAWYPHLGFRLAKTAY